MPTKFLYLSNKIFMYNILGGEDWLLCKNTLQKQLAMDLEEGEKLQVLRMSLCTISNMLSI